VVGKWGGGVWFNVLGLSLQTWRTGNAMLGEVNTYPNIWSSFQYPRIES